MARLVRRNGYVSLWECLICISVLLVLGTFLSTLWSWNRSRHDVHMLTRELMLDLQRLREYSMGSHMEIAKIWSLDVYDKEDEYYLRRATKVYKQVKFPPNAFVRGRGEYMKRVTFNYDGRPTNSMELIVSSRDGTYQKKVILAAQTGRIRVE